MTILAKVNVVTADECDCDYRENVELHDNCSQWNCSMRHMPAV
jgi:hypothetical protein